MKRKLARTAAIGLSFLMAAVYMPSASFAANTTSSVGTADQSIVENVQKAIEVSGNTDIYDYVGDDQESGEAEKAEEANKYPSEYDLSDGTVSGIADAQDVITSVKNQSPYGTCWGFAAIAAAEGSIISESVKEYGEDVKDSLRENLNLSEKHLAWFASGMIEDETDPQYGEGVVWKSGTSKNDHYETGGTPAMATSMFSSGVGPVDETESESVDEEYPNLFKYRGLNEEIEYTKTLDSESGKYVITPSCYSNEDDWSIPYKYRLYQSYKLDQSYVLPSPAGKDAKGNYQYNESGTNAIKDQLLQGRPVCIGFHADSSQPGENKDGQYIELTNWAHYTSNGNEDVDHAVTIVGYKDDYPASNFIEGQQPPADGAFLVKNSWGSSANDFPDNGGGWGIDGSGYFWLSYYDKTISMVEAMDFDVDPSDDEYYMLDQYDNCSEEYPINNTSSKVSKSSNVFTAECTEKLFSAGCQTSAPNTQVTYDVYILNNGATNPEEGYLAESKTETYEYGGYHKCTLKNGVIVQKGQKYSIVVTQKQNNGQGQYAVFMNSVFSKTAYENDKKQFNHWGKSVINKGESFIYQNGKWNDFSTVAAAIEADEDNEVEVDNFPIKGYATECKLNAQMRISLSSDTYDQRGYTGELSVSIKGNTDGLTDDTITWTSSDENVVTLEAYKDKDGNVNDAKIKVSSVGVGTAYVYASNPEMGMVVCKVTVLSPSKIKISSKKANANGVSVEWKTDASAEGYLIKYGAVGGKTSTYDLTEDEAGEDASTAYLRVKSPVKYKTYKFVICGYAYDGLGNIVYGDSTTTYVTQKPKVGTLRGVYGNTKSIYAKWNKRTCTGYQIQYSLKKSMKNAKTKKIANAETTSYNIKGLKSNQKYYVRVRAYNKATGSISYSDWSTIKSVRTK